MILISNMENLNGIANQLDARQDWQGEGVLTNATPNLKLSGWHMVIWPPFGIMDSFDDFPDIADAHRAAVVSLMYCIETAGITALVPSINGLEYLESDNLTYKIIQRQGCTHILIPDVTYFKGLSCSIERSKFLNFVREEAGKVYLLELRSELYSIGYELGPGPACDLKDMNEWPALNSLRG